MPGEPQVGQVWRERDSRVGDRQMRIIAFEDGTDHYGRPWKYAVIERLRSGRRTKIRAENLPRRWTLVA